MAGIALPRRCLERAQMRPVHLVALHQADVPEPRRRSLDGGDGIDQHRQVGRDQLRPGRTVLIGGIEDVGDFR